MARVADTKDAVLLPVFNEAGTVGCVLDAVRTYFDGLVIVVDDGSTDGTAEALAVRHEEIVLLTLPRNEGYGAALRHGFILARDMGVERLVTMDCDGQHEPAHIPQFLGSLDEGPDIVSGSRYLPGSLRVGVAPPQRQEVNRTVTAEINRVTGWNLTDAFCGFKAYRIAALASLELHEPGYAMPLELWARAFQAGLTVREVPVERIYCDNDRSFGETLDDPEARLAYYLMVWEGALAEDARKTLEQGAGR